MKSVAVIPARMASSRFPGKPLSLILGLPLIEHVRRRVSSFNIVDEVVVATCDLEIKQCVESFGGKVILTSNTHERATERVNEAVAKIQAEIVLNIQGDEPMVLPEHIQLLINPLIEDNSITNSCLVYPLSSKSDLNNTNVVKVVMSSSGKIIYLTRAPIPGSFNKNIVKNYKQSGFMAFRKKFLEQYCSMTSTPLEIQESIDLLRIIENDLQIQGVICEHETFGIDIPSHVSQVQEAITNNPVQLKIFNSIK